MCIVELLGDMRKYALASQYILPSDKLTDLRELSKMYPITIDTEITLDEIDDDIKRFDVDEMMPKDFVGRCQFADQEIDQEPEVNADADLPEGELTSRSMGADRTAFDPNLVGVNDLIADQNNLMKGVDGLDDVFDSRTNKGKKKRRQARKDSDPFASESNYGPSSTIELKSFQNGLRHPSEFSRQQSER